MLSPNRTAFMYKFQRGRNAVTFSNGFFQTVMADLDLDKVLETIRSGGSLDESELTNIARKLMEVLYMEGNVLEIPSPVTICGDIHGQLYDLFQLFDTAGGLGTYTYLFMGDYVDRGYFSIETFFYLATLKLKYPNKFYLLRGNHECRSVNQMYGFYNECLARYGHSGVWMLCNEVFDLLPMAALIDRKVFSVHGGLSPDIPIIEKITMYDRNDNLPDSGPLCDLCWSDPEQVEQWRMNQRGAGWLFGTRQIKEFCRLNGNLEFITRSHQLADNGYEWWGDNKLITVWSAPNYMYRSGNKAVVMRYKGAEGYELVEFKEMPEDKRRKPEDLQQSAYFL